MQLKIISAQPATDYYAWQVEVYLVNFLSNKCEAKDIQVIGSCNSFQPPDSWIRLQKRFPDVEFFLYKDRTGGLEYAPAIQSHVLQQHWESHPELSEHAIFFHDADFLFTRQFDFTPFLQDDVWYLSDTISYIGADYIKSKSEDVLNYMCHVAKINRELVELNQFNSGGAQKLMKNVTANYWQNVFDLSVELHAGLKLVSHIKKENDPHGIQVWTASMWAELWTAWKMGFKTSVPKEFDFCWATCPINKWNELAFFHNAGVSDSVSGMFFKADYITEYPYNKELDISNTRCSYQYYEALKGINSCLL